MKKANLAILIIILLLLVGGGVFALTRNKASAPAVTTTETTTESRDDATTDDERNTTDQQPAAKTDQNTETTITYSSRGFSPSSITVKAGSTIKIVNSSNEQVEFNSDSHPTHTDNSELNVGAIEPGGSATITVNDIGTWGYHNHLDESEAGTIIVQ
jgi:plastocyanin